MTQLRGVLTYVAVTFLVGAFVLFFGGLLLNGGTEPPGPRVGWGGPQLGMETTLVGALLLMICAGFGGGVARWTRASWEETTVVLIVVAGGLWVFQFDGTEGAHQIVRKVGWIWKRVWEGPPPTGWGI